MKKVLLMAVLLLVAGTATAGNIEFSSKKVDFGKIQQKSKGEKILTLYNRGKKPIVIKDITVDCNCISTEWQKAPVMASDSTKIKVMYTPDQKGVFYKQIRIITTEGKHVIKVSGTVE